MVVDVSWRKVMPEIEVVDLSWRKAKSIRREKPVVLPRYDMNDFLGSRQFFKEKRALRDVLSGTLNPRAFDPDSDQWRSVPAIPKMDMNFQRKQFNIKHGVMHVTSENLEFFLEQIRLYYGPVEARPQEESLIQLEGLRFHLDASVTQAFANIQEEYPKFKKHILEIKEG